MNVDIYVHVAPSFGLAKNGRAIWLISTMTLKGPATKYGIIKEENVSRRRLFLKALVTAQEQLTKKCYITLHVDDEYFTNVIYRGLLNKWSKNGYKSARGVSIRNADLWQKVYEISNKHLIKISDNPEHEYKSWMITQIRRM